MLVYLTPADFYANSMGELSARVEKYCLVFFNAPTCGFCKDLLPTFISVSEALPRLSVAGDAKACKFAVMDVTQEDMHLVKLSKKTKNELKFVPLIVLYFDGTPIAAFTANEDNPKANFELLINFITGSIKNWTAVRPGVVSRPFQQVASRPGVSAHSTGAPICGPKGKLCYFKESDAYKG